MNSSKSTLSQNAYVLPNGTPSFPLDLIGGFSAEFLILAGGSVIIAAIVLFIVFKRQRTP